MVYTLVREPLRAAQFATTGFFFIHGLMLAAWAPYIASIKDRLDLSEAALGWVLLCMAGGAVIAMQVIGRLIDRFGSKPALVGTTLCYCLLVNGPVHAPSVVALVVVLLLFGAAAGSMDVAMNAHGAVVEGRRGRPCMSSLHGAFSVGALAGAGLSAIMLSVGFEAWQHTLTSSLTGLIATPIAALFLLPGSTDQGSSSRPRPRTGPNRVIVFLGLLGAIAMMVEGAMIDWSAVYLRDVVRVDTAREGWAFAGFSAAMAVVRIAGDRLNVWVGAQRLLRLSAATALTGCLIMAFFPGLATGVAGAVLVGIGVANCVPLIFIAAAKASGERAASGLALVTGVSYCGFLVGPPMIGGLAELFSLPVAIAVIGFGMVFLIVSRLPGPRR